MLFEIFWETTLNYSGNISYRSEIKFVLSLTPNGICAALIFDNIALFWCCSGHEISVRTYTCVEHGSELLVLPW